MRARIMIENPQLCSKQHSRGYGRNGHTFTVKSYTKAKYDLNTEVKDQLRKQSWWNPVFSKVAVRMSYRANRMNVDNVAGFILDALEGAAYLKDGQVDILAVKKRRKGGDWLGITLRTLEVK